MFETKKTQLFEQKSAGKVTTPKVTSSAFVKAAMKKTHQTTALGNGALKYTTTGNDFVDQFGKCTMYKAPRTFAEISKDMSLLFSQNPLVAIKLALYFRLITRQVSFLDGKKTEHTQRGQGLRHEGIFRMIWLAINNPESFWMNVHLFIACGSWKDIITMLQYDLVYNGWAGRKLNWDNMGQLILSGLENPSSMNLIKKYLPSIKANKQCQTVESQADNMIGKWLVGLLFSEYRNVKHDAERAKYYRKYRKLKSSGTAHTWQQLISQNKMLAIDFNTVHGRALALLVSGKFLKNQGLESKYQQWIAAKPVAKYTGYPYELIGHLKTGSRKTISLEKYQRDTIDKQFMQLVEIAKNGMSDTDTGLLPVIDTSGSMESNVPGTKCTAFSVATSMALYFSYLLKGKFQDAYAEFSDSAIMREWKGRTPIERIENMGSSITAGTNFQAVADLLVDVKRKGVPESEFPTGIICISDGCFNHTGSKNQFEELKSRLKKGGFSKGYINNFKCILWDVPNNYYSKRGNQAFEAFADQPNLFHIGGLDPASIAFITGIKGKERIPQTSDELFEAAMDQEVLNMVDIL